MLNAKVLQLNTAGASHVKRVLSFVLAVALLFGCVILPEAPKACAASSAQLADYLTIGGVEVSSTQSLVDNGDGTYTLTLSFAMDTHTDVNTDASLAADSYFEAPFAGDYLIELWGGDGADGSDSDTPGGTGGTGGHVYGVVQLDAGDVLFYTLGGDGAVTASTEAGGGDNGDGGNHGDLGSYEVGGGGGYSALYLVKEAHVATHFNDDYTLKNADFNGDGVYDAASDFDFFRLTHHIMVAGGGGGGGAGNWRRGATGTADGGAGGSNTSANTGTLSVGDVIRFTHEDENGNQVTDSNSVKVSGTWFGGENGKSNGDSDAYTGKGATYLPGTVVGTAISDILDWAVLQELLQGKQPNDWYQTFDPTSEGGHGGAGNLRGGAGGAGYAGGSGGDMESILFTGNIGGGGGGSSFIADSVDYVLNSAQQELLTGENPSTTGGAVHVAYLGGAKTNHLKDLTISGTVSAYFDIVKDSSNVTVNGDGTFQVTGAAFGTGEALEMQLTLQPKEGFVGGNDVPLLTGGLSCLDGSGQTTELTLADSCSYVNVPLDFGITTYSYVTDKTDVTYGASDADGITAETKLFDIEDHTARLGYGTFAAVSSYFVNGVAADKFTVTPNSEGTYEYTVSYTVTPTEGSKAEVGEKNTALTITDKAIVEITSWSDDTPLGDNQNMSVQYVKSLAYDTANQRYVLSLDVKATSKYGYTVTETTPSVSTYSAVYGQTATTDSYFTKTSSTSSNGVSDINEYTFTAPATGYYLIQLWAGNGGDYKVSIGTFWGESDAVGGDGGYVYGFVKLNRAQTISLVVGAKGNNGNLIDSSSSAKPTFVFSTQNSTNTVLMIARGGDGAARKSPGVDAVTTGVGTFDTADGAIPSNYVGQSGNNLNTNYRSASVFDSIDAIRNDGITDAQKELIANLSDPTSVDDGQTVGSAKITPILITETSTTESGTAEAAANAIAAFNQPFSVTASISEYFKIADSSDITVTDTGNGSGVINTYVDISETTGTNTAGIATFKETAEITNIIPAPPAEATKNTTDKTYSATASFRVDIPLAPIDGFLGGNDVPVLSSMVLSQTVDGTKNELNIAANPKTDYANVALAELPDFTTNDHQYYVVGVDEPIDPTTLYAFNTAEMGLLDDFVTRSVTFTDENGTPITGDLAPTRTTTYTATASMSPTDSAPDAVVIPAVSGKTQSKYATIYTQHQIQYQLTNAVCSDGVTAININDGQTHSVTVSPATGYHELSVTVKYPDGSTETPAVADDAVTVKFGDLSGLSGPVIVTATATPKPIEYKVVKVYTGDQGVIHTQTHETTFQAGETLTGVDWGFDKLTSDAAKPGHTYGWKWDTADGTMPETMPAHDLYVYGTLWPDQYDVTIHYYRGAENSENLAHTVQEKITFGVAYTVPTDLTIPGYDAPTPDTVLIDTEAEIPANGVLDPISVIYTPQTYDLVINRIYSDGMVQIAPETQENAITFDQEYAFTVPTAVGYTVTADRESPILIDSESEIPADGQVTLTYTYTPEQYDLIIEVYYNDAVQSTVTKSDAVTFNQDLTVVAPAVENYTPSPATQTIKVDSSTHASLVSGGAVTVRFEYTVIDPGNFVVNYVYVDKIVGETAPDSTLTLDVDGTEYTISVPTGYEAYKDTNKKTPYKESERTFVGEASQIYNVYLFAKYYTVSLNPDGGSLPDGADLYFTVKHGGAYPQLPDPTREDHFFENWYYDTDANGEYSGDTELVQGGADLKVTSDHTLYAQWTPHIVSVTVAWGNLTFGYAPGWNPEKHIYEADTFTPVGTNAVTVTNNTESNVNVDVTIEGTLIAGDDLRSDDLTFTEDENQTNKLSSDTLTNGESTTFWVWLTGKLTLPDLSNTDFVVGQCTVTISKSEEE